MWPEWLCRLNTVKRARGAYISDCVSATMTYAAHMERMINIGLSLCSIVITAQVLHTLTGWCQMQCQSTRTYAHHCRLHVTKPFALYSAYAVFLRH